MEIPGYVVSPNQELYQKLLNITLINGLSDRGWTVPNVAYATIQALAPSMPLGTIWYNTDTNKLVVKTGQASLSSTGLEAITSVAIPV
jgi:hypothetical protein